eukprot:CAMPEP_0181126104 /NCGR_PEP_ID=MMETSP1071-20121207/27428_1 /TAXON_ID=35127 /ORGANISM="Thalassiosira sp., Strain NH16" /LENGTH=62 /DNA_ID=CAMNT_0023211637 /DNA_START=35 /DNA_END=219 /DNA_ORIENTATION=+
MDDPIFQSLLLNGGTNAATGGSVAGGADTQSDGGTGMMTTARPRPSRYAQLVPREAMRARRP